jgi:hypothetical protein
MTQQVIYGLIRDNGDGSGSMCWFRNLNIVERLLEDDDFYANEGSPAETLYFPVSLDLSLCGFIFDDEQFEGVL